MKRSIARRRGDKRVMTRAERIGWIVERLLLRERVTAPLVARCCRAALRSVYRDFRALRRVVRWDREGKTYKLLSRAEGRRSPRILDGSSDAPPKP